MLAKFDEYSDELDDGFSDPSLFRMPSTESGIMSNSDSDEEGAVVETEVLGYSESNNIPTALIRDRNTGEKKEILLRNNNRQFSAPAGNAKRKGRKWVAKRKDDAPAQATHDVPANAAKGKTKKKVSASVIRQRARNNRQKASRANHNRKRGAAKKRMRG